MKTNPIKVLITAAGSFLSSLLGILYIPVLMLAVSNVIDYVTGLMAAPSRTDGGISSYRSFKGIAKKVCMWLLVGVGGIIDSLLLYAGDVIGITMPFKFLMSCVVAIWLICNELISILENMIDIGANIPAFLMPIVKNIKKQTESLVNSNETGEEEKQNGSAKE